jgi:hypothetical protein
MASSKSAGSSVLARASCNEYSSKSRGSLERGSIKAGSKTATGKTMLRQNAEITGNRP